jgi:hypothetical protein
MSVEEYARKAEGASFSGAVANMVAMTAPDLPDFMKSVAALLHTGGWFIATLPHPAFWPTYWGYQDAPWFRYSAEIAIEAPFQISVHRTHIRTTHFHRPIEFYGESLSSAGFFLDRLREPYPEATAEALYPELWSFPRFLAFRAQRL